MFQQFDSRTSPANAAPRLARLRAEMATEGIDAFLVPHSDEQQNEYLPANAERLSWLTGFTGSAGFCIVTAQTAILFVDGRYTLQAGQQCDPDLFEIADLVSGGPAAWIARNAGKLRIGYDPWLLTVAQEKSFLEAADKAKATLRPTANLVDRVWTDRPVRPTGSAAIRETALAGQDVAGKLEAVRSVLAEAGADAVILSDPASVCWVLNLRGNDIAHIPVVLSWAVVPLKGKVTLFIDRTKLDAAAASGLETHCTLADPSGLAQWLVSFAHGQRVMIDPALVNIAIRDAILAGKGEIVKKRDPVVLLRAVKNAAELAGMRAAHLRDGIAVTRFLAWIDRQEIASLDEIGAATRLEEIRRETASEKGSELCEISFDTISGFGPHGAIVHYRVTRETNAGFAPDALYLVDSGAQYSDGTTDITRTIAIGNPPNEAVRDATLVLKGHIAIATARFPGGTRGIDIDALARIALWREGKDYAHGTGHGVGAYLSVHEGPQSISKRGMEELRPGMIVSNEPGYYRTGHYGIRLENLEIVAEAADHPGFLEFECVTLAPMDRRLVAIGMLTAQEREWWNRYHARVLSMVGPHLDEPDRNWLIAACAPL
ncbi:MAG: aminopeptidase P family protein [Nitratireductor sp.]|nr:aminopeptidase P family protein [Nitratireductor sp.]